MNKKNESLKNTGLFLAFAGPAVFAFMAVVIIPFLYGFYLTFTSWDGLSKSKPFVGLANYAEVFKDTGFWQALGLTLIYVVVSVVLVNVVAGYRKAPWQKVLPCRLLRSEPDRRNRTWLHLAVHFQDHSGLYR